MKLIPLADKIVIKRLESSDKTPGGVFLPDSSRDKPKMGKVLAVGDGELVEGKRQPLDVKEGQVVLFKHFAGDEVKLGTEVVLIMSATDLLAIVVE